LGSTQKKYYSTSLAPPIASSVLENAIFRSSAGRPAYTPLRKPHRTLRVLAAAGEELASERKSRLFLGRPQKTRSAPKRNPHSPSFPSSLLGNAPPAKLPLRLRRSSEQSIRHAECATRSGASRDCVPKRELGNEEKPKAWERKTASNFSVGFSLSHICSTSYTTKKAVFRLKSPATFEYDAAVRTFSQA
jgi:hypothetical protein